MCYKYMVKFFLISIKIDSFALPGSAYLVIPIFSVALCYKTVE